MDSNVSTVLENQNWHPIKYDGKYAPKNNIVKLFITAVKHLQILNNNIYVWKYTSMNYCAKHKKENNKKIKNYVLHVRWLIQNVILKIIINNNFKLKLV